MKFLFTSMLAVSVCGVVFAAEPKPAGQFKDSRDKISYSLGVNIGNSMKMQGADLNVDEVANGLREALAGKAKLDEKEVRETLMSWNQELRNKRMEKMKVEGEKNRKAGEDWLAANAKKPGVKTFPEGMQYKVLVAGKGAKVKAGDRVSTHYKGTLTDGTQFDSSYERGQPFTTSTLGGVIPGWLLALTNMTVGDKWELYIPSPLAYGDAGRPPKIPGGATLVFEMEVLGIEPPQAGQTTPGAPALNSLPGAGNPQLKLQPGTGGAQPQQIQLKPAAK